MYVLFTLYEPEAELFSLLLVTTIIIIHVFMQISFYLISLTLSIVQQGIHSPPWVFFWHLSPGWKTDNNTLTTITV